jgi:beta-lactamase class A
MLDLSRRAFALGLALAAALPATARPRSLDDRLRDIERDAGGRLGVYAVDAEGRGLAAHRATERFLLCSTFKAFLAGATLARVESGEERLDRAVPVAAGDLVSYSPAVERAVAGGSMSVEALCEAAVVLSDNAAANLLLAPIGGPAGMTRYFRSLGGDAARLDRSEPELNRREGAKDTTTPEAAAMMLRRLLARGTLAAASRERLEGWMIASRTGRARLRAGLPEVWRAGDKTGTGPAGETNDVAFVDAPGRGRIFIAAYYEGPARTSAERNAVLADVGRAIAASLT